MSYEMAGAGSVVIRALVVCYASLAYCPHRFDPEIVMHSTELRPGLGPHAQHTTELLKRLTETVKQVATPILIAC